MRPDCRERDDDDGDDDAIDSFLSLERIAHQFIYSRFPSLGLNASNYHF